jgi:hypothetical protein
MLTPRTNSAVKAISTACFERVKRYAKIYGENSVQYAHALFEYELAVRSSDSKPDRFGVVKYHCMPVGGGDADTDSVTINGTFSRRYGGHCGATKRTHTHHPDGWEMQFFVVKRYRHDGWDFNGEGTGNQLVDEIRCWLKLQNTADADFLCPILKYETAKSDKCRSLSDTMKERVCIVAQKAVHVDTLAGACHDAERRNRESGYHGISAESRIAQLENMAKRMHWRDVRHNPGNSGVIFDYAQGCYKAVFIDYAL